ncbi:MAG: glycosyl hydrolase 53 family protein [Lacibacter sp.]
MKQVVVFVIAVFLVAACTKPKSQTVELKQYNWQTFVMGVDLSYVNEIEDAAGVYKKDGKQTDPYVIFKSIGANTVRVRLWHNPSWKKNVTGGKMYSDLFDVEKTIRRAKEQGMAVNLDLHYSDDWADPSHQALPAAWNGLSLAALKDSVYNYTLAVLNYLKLKNLVPEMIQVGNETNSGMLWPAGKVNTESDFVNFGLLLNSGIKAVRDFSAASTIKPKIILHVAQLQNADYWTANITSKGNVTDFDIIGVSHYYKWSNINDNSTIGSTIAALKNKYQKDIMIVETAFPWTGKNADSYNNIFYTDQSTLLGYPVSGEGQQKYLKDLIQTIAANGGKGLMYWEPAWITSNMFDRWGTGSSWENNAFFDFNGNLLSNCNYMMWAYEFK